MKTYLNFFKRTAILLFAVGTLSSAEECDWFEDEEIDCHECIAAQAAYFNALQNSRCAITYEVGEYAAKVKDKCGSSYGKQHIDRLASACKNYDEPSYICE